MQTAKLKHLYATTQNELRYNEIARQIYETSFPEDERRNFDLLKALDEKSNLDFFVITDNQANAIGIISLWSFEEFIYIEHFAIQQNERGKGIGSSVLSSLANKYSKPVLLEVELPENDLAKRRIAFYQRHGFAIQPYDYTQPAYDKTKQSLPMIVMIKADFEITKRFFDSAIATIYKEVYGL